MIDVGFVIAGVIGLLIGVVIAVVLLPVFNDFLNDAGLGALNVSGTVSDYSWAHTVFIIMYLLFIIGLPVALVLGIYAKVLK